MPSRLHLAASRDAGAPMFESQPPRSERWRGSAGQTLITLSDHLGPAVHSGRAGPRHGHG